jgi:hypothetical protein
MEILKSSLKKLKSNSRNKILVEITWNTITDYLKEKYETPIPMYGTDTCVLIVKPGASIELQMRSKDAFKTDSVRLPQLTRFRYEHVSTKNYKYLAIVCDFSEFDETVLNFYNSIASKFVLKKLSADKAIINAFDQWKKMLLQIRIPDEYTLEGIWGELFIIDLVLGNNA